MDPLLSLVFLKPVDPENHIFTKIVDTFPNYLLCLRLCNVCLKNIFKILVMYLKDTTHFHSCS